jgi:preprotein translocase subunit YajC
MSGHGNTFLMITILALLTILLIAAMKYFVAARRAQADSAQMKPDLAEIKQRLAAIETILRQVD